jgi:hypothetical protein
MHLTHEIAEHLSRVRRALRRELDSSLCQSKGAWWIPSIAACVVWAWLANHERKRHA